jgi:hypothetical protein
VFSGSREVRGAGLQAAGVKRATTQLAGRSRLSGVEGGVVPRVGRRPSDIDATTIDVALQGRLMKAAGA